MLTVRRHRLIRWRGVLGLRIKVGYTLICFQKGERLITRGVWGDAVFLSAFINAKRVKMTLHWGFGRLPAKAGS